MIRILDGYLMGRREGSGDKIYNHFIISILDRLAVLDGHLIGASVQGYLNSKRDLS
jgi:hypothetical protein